MVAFVVLSNFSSFLFQIHGVVYTMSVCVSILFGWVTACFQICGKPAKRVRILEEKRSVSCSSFVCALSAYTCILREERKKERE